MVPEDQQRVMQEGKRIKEFGLSSDLGDREAVGWHKFRTNDHLGVCDSHDLTRDCRRASADYQHILTGLILKGVRKQYGKNSW